MEKIVLIGASGYIGSHILREALERGHKVTGVVRHPEKVKTEHPNLIVRQGDVTLADTVTEICNNADAVICAYNPGWSNPDIADETLRTYRVILEGVKRSGAKRLMVVGGAGSLFVSAGIRLMDSGAMPEAYLPAVRALANVYLEILESEKVLDWIFFSPAGIIEPGLRTGKFRLGKDDLIVNEKGESRISVQDYAMAMIDELENPVHHRERFTIGY